MALPRKPAPPVPSSRGPQPAAAAPSLRRPATIQPPDELPVDEAPLPRSLGRWVLLKRIARGGMGEVFLASTSGIEGAERPVIVKVIRREHVADPSFLARFLDEARVQAQLQHSGVAQVMEAALDDATGEPYAVVEYVEGRSLGELRSRALSIGYTLAWPEAVSIAQLVAEALAHIHERKDASGRALAIVHRDLSPQNVMVSYAGEAKIIDFGTARGQNRRCHTVAGVVFAKPGYVAPEVANGDSGDARVDLYALGVMLWELCAGRRFLDGEPSEHLARVAKNERNLPPIAAEVGAPVELDRIVAKLTAFQRDARYLSARAVATDLARALSSASPLSSGERGVRSRVAHLLQHLFPGEPNRIRREFVELVDRARAKGFFDARPKDREAPPPPPSRSARGALPDAPDLLAGTRYALLREVGRGATSVVWEAEHADLGRRVALKLLDTSGLDPEQKTSWIERLRREARQLAALSSERLVKVTDFGETDDGRVFCAMELLEGETLEARLAREGGALPWREAVSLASRVLEGLVVAHGAGLVHGDLKPANLFLPRAPEGAVKVLDFGLAARSGGSTSESGDGSPMRLAGTPEYLAPEQASGTVTERSDLYALGCVLYEALTGSLPFRAESTVALLDAKLHGSPEPLRERAPDKDLPPALDDVVARALARHPSVRFATAADMLAALEASLRETPVVAPLPKRKPGRLIAATLGLALALAGGLFALPGARARLLGAPAAVDEAAPALVAEAPPVETGAGVTIVEEVAPPTEPSSLPAPAAPPVAAKSPATPTDPAEPARRAPKKGTDEEPDGEEGDEEDEPGLLASLGTPLGGIEARVGETPKVGKAKSTKKSPAKAPPKEGKATAKAPVKAPKGATKTASAPGNDAGATQPASLPAKTEAKPAGKTDPKASPKSKAAKASAKGAVTKTASSKKAVKKGDAKPTKAPAAKPAASPPSPNP